MGAHVPSEANWFCNPVVVSWILTVSTKFQRFTMSSIIVKKVERGIDDDSFQPTINADISFKMEVINKPLDDEFYKNVGKQLVNALQEFKKG